MSGLAGLKPPEITRTDELDWVLRASLSEGAVEDPGRFDPERFRRTVGGLGLAERLAARPVSELLPPANRELLRQSLIRSTATALMYEGTARLLASLASDLGLPLVFLKGFALHALRLQPAGSRPFGDLDLLARPADAERLYNAAQAAGFSAHAAPPTDQHLPILTHPERGAVEIHFQLRGLSRRDGTPITYDDLQERGAMIAAPELPGASHLPERSALAAHILVHGLQQHLLRPRTYPLCRMLADLGDLLPSEEHWEDLEARWGEALAATVAPDLLLATADLVRELRAGSRLELAADKPPMLLLRHIVAGSLSDDYADTLASTYLARRIADARRSGRLLAYVRTKLFGRSPDGALPRSPFAALSSFVKRQLRAIGGRWRLARRRPPATESDPLESRVDEP